MTSITASPSVQPAAHFFEQLERYARSGPSCPVGVFQVGHVSIDLLATTPELAQRLRRPLSHLQHRSSDGPRLQIVLAAADPAAPPFPWPEAGLAGGVREWAADGYWFSQYGADLAVVGYDSHTQHAVGYVQAATRLPAAFFSGLLFTTIYQALRPLGYFLLHAAALSWQGAGVLITGPSGAGKTTTMLQCVRAGFQFIADDATLLSLQTSGQVHAISTLNTMHVTPQTVALFPELTALAGDAIADDKTTLFVPEIYPQAMATITTARLLIVPTLHGPRDGSLEPLSARTILADALPLSVDLSQPEATTAHLDLLFHLVSTVRCCRLHLPPEIDTVPNLIQRELQHVTDPDRHQTPIRTP